MRNLFNKSARIGDKLIKQTVNAPKLNYDFRRHFASSRLLTNCRHVRTFSLIPTNQRSSFHSSITKSLLTKPPEKPANHASASLSIQLSKHAYSSEHGKKYSDLIDTSFQTTSLSFTRLPEIRLPKHLRSKKMSAASGTAKWHLKNIFYLLKTHYEEEEENRKPIKNRFDVLTDYTRCGGDFWECTITVSYPFRQFFKAQSRRKQEAENNACQLALQWIKDQGVVNADNRPIVLEKQKLQKHIDSKKGILEPLSVKKFNSAQRKYMEDFIDIFELKHKGQLENEVDLYLSHEVNRQTLNYQDTRSIQAFFSSPPEEFNADKHELYNMVSGRPLKKMNIRDRERINNQLNTFLHRRDNSRVNNDHQFDQYQEYKNKLKNLPIHAYREQLLDLIFENQVVVISGETGCGKSTQIPQYILEDMIRGGCGADCSIIVTQPRRLPAISVSEQTSLQFGERMIGNSFGYQVRFEKELPIRDNGVVLFCTTGMLLRKMSGNPYLLGVSHLILDEVHEREFLADLTFILLKKILEKNDRIKIILMSASLNAEVFSKFFKNCPIYQIPGRCFPVERFYLDQIERDLRRPAPKQANKSNSDRRVDYGLVTDLIHHINNTEIGNDSILCFLPGWSDIKKIGEELNKTNYQVKKSAPALTVIPVHSKLSSEDQKAIFRPLQNGLRKVILSTNIAETSLTVPDVVYVIDPGLCNETFYNKEYNVSTFGTHLISQANAKQREGRAGRVKPGVCYKLYTQETEQTQMLKYFLPEILRIPLETAVMYSKLYCPDEKVDDFLSNALEPPSKSAILSAVQTLKLINVLDDDEHLTLLGRKIVDLSTHPRLSVCLITSAMLGCFNQVLSLSALLSQAKDPFAIMPGNRGLVKTIKESIANRNMGDNFGSTLSDYYALYNLLQMHENSMDEFGKVDIDAQMILNEYRQFINFGTLESARHLKKLYTTDLGDNGIGDNDEMNFDSLSSNCLFDLALLSGLYPNCCKYVNERNSQKFQLIDVNTGHQTNYSSESILSTARIDNESYFVSIYFDSYYSEERRKLMIKNASLISSVYVLFACKNLKLVKEEGPLVTFILDDCKFLIFTMDKQDLRLILKWKDILQVYQNWYLCNEKNSTSSQFIYLRKTFKEFLDLTNKVFDRYAKHSEVSGTKESLGNYS